MQPTPAAARDSSFWHPSWIRYAEFEGRCLILHYVNGDRFFIVVCTGPIRRHLLPDDVHTVFEGFQAVAEPLSESEGIAAFEAAELRLLAGEL